VDGRLLEQRHVLASLNVDRPLSERYGVIRAPLNGIPYGRPLGVNVAVYVVHKETLLAPAPDVPKGLMDARFGVVNVPLSRRQYGFLSDSHGLAIDRNCVCHRVSSNRISEHPHAVRRNMQALASPIRL
jgi:hypothetical protein